MIEKASVHIMLKSPSWIYAYWHLPPSTAQEFDDLYGTLLWEKSKLFLRLVSENQCNSFDIKVPEESNSCHINIYAKNSSIRAYLGRKLAKGKFIVLARSNTISTVSGQVSEVVDPSWSPSDIWTNLETDFDHHSSIYNISSLSNERMKL